jgi:hypothetical protein
MTVLNAEHARRAIVEHTRRLAESAAAARLDAAVPTTPGWTITDLVEHVGPDPALARQHRPRQRLIGTEAPTATTEGTFGMNRYEMRSSGKQQRARGTSSPAVVQLDRASRRIRR